MKKNYFILRLSVLSMVEILHTDQAIKEKKGVFEFFSQKSGLIIS